MVFCPNCGQKLIDGAIFCQNCGTQVARDETENKEQRKAVYVGELHKCPNCGEALNSFEIICHTCKYELRGVKASDSVLEFALKLEQAETEKQKIILIRTFPIPNSKEELFEFMILASSNFDATSHTIASNTMQKEVADAWLAKFERCYQKAKLVLINDSDFSKIQDIYDQTYEKINIEMKNATIKKILDLIAKNIGMFCGIILLIIAIIIETPFRSGSRILFYGYSPMIQLAGCITLIISAVTLKRKDAALIEFGIGALSGVLSILFAGFLRNGSMLLLSGGIILIIVMVNYFKSLGSEKKKD